MRTLGIYLWKEWREFRSIAIGLVVSVPLLLLLAGLPLGNRAFADHDGAMSFALVGGLGALIVALFALTTDLVAGEVRRGRIEFLGRLPSGLPAAFVAKSIVFLVGAAGSFAYGFWCGALVAEWRGGFEPTLAEVLSEPAFVWCALIVCGALPAACMAPRGVLVLPLAALIWGAVLLAFVTLAEHGGLTVRSFEAFLKGWSTPVFVAAAIGVATYFAFVRGYRFGGGWPRAMRGGMLIVALACAVPGWPMARAAIARHDPEGGTPTIARVLLSHDGRHAYIERLTHLGGQTS